MRTSRNIRYSSRPSVLESDLQYSKEPFFTFILQGFGGGLEPFCVGLGIVGSVVVGQETGVSFDLPDGERVLVVIVIILKGNI